MLTKLSSQAIHRRTTDYILLLTLVLLAVVGFMIIFSAVSGLPKGQEVIGRYLIALPLAVGAYLFGWGFNYQIYNEQWKPLYIFVLGFLASVLVIGVVVKGSNSWIRLGLFSIQPTEICRIATLLIGAAFLTNHAKNIKDFKTLFLFALLIAPIFALILLQPDVSSLLVTGPALLVLLYVAGVNTFYFILLAAYLLVAAVFSIAWTYIAMHPSAAASGLMYALGQTAHNWVYILGFCVAVLLLFYAAQQVLKQFRINVPMVFVLILAGAMLAGFFSAFVVNKQLKTYQRKRIETFLAPRADPRGAGYNVLQAQIAMGAGGVAGKGFFSGTQSRLGFVPERHTDFILAVLGEELGLFGTLGVLALYILLLWRTVAIALVASDRYGFLVCCGVFGVFFTYMVFNFGMLIGFMPVAGIPLPFISYGGSNLVASAWAFGVVQSVYRRRLSVV